VFWRIFEKIFLKLVLEISRFIHLKETVDTAKFSWKTKQQN
jgi:hypothetical protein